MDDLDRFLQSRLREMLDPIVASAVPARRVRTAASGIVLAPPQAESSPEATGASLPVTSTLPIAATQV